MQTITFRSVQTRCEILGFTVIDDGEFFVVSKDGIEDKKIIYLDSLESFVQGMEFMRQSLITESLSTRP